MGAQQCFVNVKVTNNGPAPYPANSTDVVRLYWAKASAGLSWPAPWNDPASVHGGTVAPAQPIGAIPVGGSQTLVFTWPVTPNPAHFKGDGHFCLLAMIAKATTPEFDGLQGPDLNENVLRLTNVAWRNIHIAGVAPYIKADLVIENATDERMRAQVTFEPFDESAARADPWRGRILLTPRDAAIDDIWPKHQGEPFLEQVGEGTFAVTPAIGIPPITLRPEQSFALGLAYDPPVTGNGYGVRATQWAIEGASRRRIGGQTFVAGRVAGFSAPPKKALGCLWPVLTAFGSLLLLGALFRKRDRQLHD